jgi:hypothetical protein
MINLYNAETGELVGTLTDAELRFLNDNLEEESAEDRDYYISAATVDYLQDNGSGANLLSLLRQAMGENQDVTIRWSRS